MLSMHSFLGPLMAPLIKLLLLPRRLLIYAPAPVERAAIVAFNLAELVHAAFVYAVHVPGHVRNIGTNEAAATSAIIHRTTIGVFFRISGFSSYFYMVHF